MNGQAAFLNVHWLHPAWAWLLAAVPLVAILLLWSQRRRRRLALSWWGASPMKPKGRFQAMRAWLWLPILGCFIFAAMGPAWGRLNHSPLDRGRALVILLDASRSMNAWDDQPLSRWQRARVQVQTMLEEMRRQGRPDPVGIIMFTGQARWLCPLTTDFDHLRWLLSWRMPEQGNPARRLTPRQSDGVRVGTDLASGLHLAAKWLDQEPRRRLDLLLISDGDDLAHHDPDALAARLASRGHRLHVLGMGDPHRSSRIPSGIPEEPFLFTLNDQQQRVWVTSRGDAERLQGLARQGQGSWLAEAAGRDTLARWWREQIAPLPTDVWTGDQRALLIPRFHWPLALGLLGLAWQIFTSPIIRRQPTAAIQRSAASTSITETAAAGSPTGSSWPAAAARFGLFSGLFGLMALAGAMAVSDDLLPARLAYERGDLPAALQHLQTALGRSADPGWIAYHQGVVALQLGREADAVQAFRCCLEDAAGLRRAKALLGLGCGLAQLGQRATGPSARTTLADADAAFAQAEKLLLELLSTEPTAQRWLDDARHNRQVAQQWRHEKAMTEAAEGPPTPPLLPSSPPSDAAQPEPNRPPRITPLDQEPPIDASDPRLTEERRPGRGHLPVIFGPEPGPALSPQEAEAVLRDQLRRIGRIRSTMGAASAQLPANEQDW